MRKGHKEVHFTLLLVLKNKKKPETVSMKHCATSTSTQEHTSVHIAEEKDGRIFVRSILSQCNLFHSLQLTWQLPLLVWQQPLEGWFSPDTHPSYQLDVKKKNLLEEETNWTLTTWWQHRWNRHCRGNNALDDDLQPQEPPLARCPHWSTTLEGKNVGCIFWQSIKPLTDTFSKAF